MFGGPGVRRRAPGFAGEPAELDGSDARGYDPNTPSPNVCSGACRDAGERLGRHGLRAAAHRAHAGGARPQPGAGHALPLVLQPVPGLRARVPVLLRAPHPRVPGLQRRRRLRPHHPGQARRSPAAGAGAGAARMAAGAGGGGHRDRPLPAPRGPAAPDPAEPGRLPGPPHPRLPGDQVDAGGAGPGPPGRIEPGGARQHRLDHHHHPGPGPGPLCRAGRPAAPPAPAGRAHAGGGGGAGGGDGGAGDAGADRRPRGAAAAGGGGGRGGGPRRGRQPAAAVRGRPGGVPGLAAAGRAGPGASVPGAVR